MDFNKLQSDVSETKKDVTEIKDALLGTKYSANGIIQRVNVIECDTKAQGEIVQEINRWKCEAQKWKEKAEIQLTFFEQVKWKFAGAMIVISIIVPIVWGYIKQKIGL